MNPQDNKQVDLEVLISKLEEGAFFGEEILYEELDSHYMYTAKVQSFDCKLLAFEKGTNSKDFSTLLLAQSLKKGLRLKMNCRNELLAKILSIGIDKLRSCYAEQQTSLDAADVDSLKDLASCALCKNKHEKLNVILTRDIPRSLLREEPLPTGTQASPDRPPSKPQQKPATITSQAAVIASRLLRHRQVSLHKKNLSAELTSVIYELPSKHLDSSRLASRKPSVGNERSQPSPELPTKSESSRALLPDISTSRMDKKHAPHQSSKHASSKSYGMGSIDTLSTINRQLKAKPLSKSHPSVIPDNKNCFNVCATLQENMQKVQSHLKLRREASVMGLSDKHREEPNTSGSKTLKGDLQAPRIGLRNPKDLPREFIFSKLLSKDSSLLFSNCNLPRLPGPDFSTRKKRIGHQVQASSNLDELSYQVFDKSINNSAVLNDKFPPDQGPSLPPSPTLSHESLRSKNRNKLQPGKFSSVTERRISISRQQNKLAKL